jgi:putative methyltransferase (TIGR04325 family)
VTRTSLSITRRRLDFVLGRALPPFLHRRVTPWLKEYGYFGDYETWDAAVRNASGYDSNVILERVRDALLKVKSGEARGERDSVLFDHVDYSFPVIAGMLRAAMDNDRTLSVLDFGGSLGSSYFQLKQFFPPLKRLEWSVVEQAAFVACGRQHFEDGHLRFFGDLDECLAVRRPQVCLLSGVLPYVPDPFKLVADLVARGFDMVIIDRTPFRDVPTDRLVVQRVQPEIYPASYPAWLLSRTRLLSAMQPRFELLAEFDSLRAEMFDRAQLRCLGFIFTAARNGHS